MQNILSNLDNDEINNILDNIEVEDEYKYENASELIAELRDLGIISKIIKKHIPNTKRI